MERLARAAAPLSGCRAWIPARGKPTDLRMHPCPAEPWASGSARPPVPWPFPGLACGPPSDHAPAEAGVGAGDPRFRSTMSKTSRSGPTDASANPARTPPTAGSRGGMNTIRTKRVDVKPGRHLRATMSGRRGGLLGGNMVEDRNRRWTPLNADRPGRPALHRQHCGWRSAGGGSKIKSTLTPNITLVVRREDMGDSVSRCRISPRSAAPWQV